MFIEIVNWGVFDLNAAEGRPWGYEAQVNGHVTHIIRVFLINYMDTKSWQFRLTLAVLMNEQNLFQFIGYIIRNLIWKQTLQVHE